MCVLFAETLSYQDLMSSEPVTCSAFAGRVKVAGAVLQTQVLVSIVL